MVFEIDDTDPMYMRCVGVYAEDVAIDRPAQMNRAIPADGGRGRRFVVSDALPLVSVGGVELTVNDGHAHLYPPPHAKIIVHTTV
ncbi:hypothetical protein CH299_18625 [Rhodococcus sp. 14-2686-1-2]|nr:hypothetical protein CH301_17930 [Rhodococcus sp. 15-1189-1-1a]OZF12138.1 hypothetical protein CH299_18625 [Rhodococcus sp. 14-2686-1-2]